MSANLCYEGKRHVVHLGSFAPVRQSYPLSRSLWTLTRSHNTPSKTVSLSLSIRTTSFSPKPCASLAF